MNITIPDDDWDQNDGIDNPSDHLITTLVINGVSHHLEAWAVEIDGGDLQAAVSPAYAQSFELLHQAVCGDGAFQVTTIRNREYILVATPFC